MNMTLKISKKIIYSIIGILGICFFIKYQTNPIRKMDVFLTTQNYKEAVAYYNENLFDDNTSIELEKSIEECINSVLCDWNEEKTSYEEAKNIFEMFAEIQNEQLSLLAQKDLLYIDIEKTGNEILLKAEFYYNQEEYLEAMVSVLEADEAYSQYIVLSNLYEECKGILLRSVNTPETIEDYNKDIVLLNTYIEATNDEDFIEGKNVLEIELEEYQKIYDILTEATNLYENTSYKESFDILNKGLEQYPDHEKIQYALSAYQYAYVLNVTEQVITYMEAENYEEAITLLENAINAYDCETFQELLTASRKEVDTLFAVQEWFLDAGDYIWVSAKKMVLGEFEEDKEETVLSLGGNVAASVFGVDAPLDIRDLAYDISHWGEGEYFAANLVLDAISIIPVIGAVKYLKHIDTATDLVKAVDKGSDVIDSVHDAVKTAENITEVGKQVDKIVDVADVIADVRKKSDVVSDVVDGGKTANKTIDVVEEVIHYAPLKTINQGLENSVHPETGIAFVRKNLDLSDGNRVTGVFPEFDSCADVMLPEKYFKASFNEQKKYLSEYLKNMVNTPEMMKKFTKEQLEDIAEGIIPDGFVWHHNETEGLMQLVDVLIHDKTGHTGGMSIWGIGYK